MSLIKQIRLATFCQLLGCSCPTPTEATFVVSGAPDLTAGQHIYTYKNLICKSRAFVELIQSFAFY